MKVSDLISERKGRETREEGVKVGESVGMRVYRVCMRERKNREHVKKIKEKKKKRVTQLQLPLSASNAKHICNRNFFVAMYLPTNDDLLLHFCLHFILILFREQ